MTTQEADTTLSRKTNSRRKSTRGNFGLLAGWLFGGRGGEAGQSGSPLWLILGVAEDRTSHRFRRFRRF